MTAAPVPVRWWQPALFLTGITVISGLFAMVEIQIEGAAGWAANLPTWRIEHHWLLDLFWGGRPLTGYHAWVFPFITAVFHAGFLISGRWTLRQEARALSAILLFWIIEDALWFVFNPAYGWAKLTPAAVPWHKHWILGLPTDYWTFSTVAAITVRWSYTPEPTAP